MLRTADTLVLGDSWSDRELFAAGGLNVFVWPRTASYEALAASRLRALPRLWSDLDAVLVGDSLEPLVALRCSAR